MAQLRCELEEVWRGSLYTGMAQRERQLMRRISELLAREEAMEKQRSCITWLKEGDRNTKLFQAKSKERAKVNHIGGLKSPDGTIVIDQDQVEALALFTAQPEQYPDNILSHVPVRVTEVMNESLRPCSRPSR